LRRAASTRIRLLASAAAVVCLGLRSAPLDKTVRMSSPCVHGAPHSGREGGAAACAAFLGTSLQPFFRVSKLTPWTRCRGPRGRSPGKGRLRGKTLRSHLARKRHFARSLRAKATVVKRRVGSRGLEHTPTADPGAGSGTAAGWTRADVHPPGRFSGILEYYSGIRITNRASRRYGDRDQVQ
jgi:hypothetical protein